jgi:hypothetical protein
MLNVPTLITSGTNLNLDAEIISPAIHLRSPTPIQASMLTRRVYENHKSKMDARFKPQSAESAEPKTSRPVYLP